MKNFLRVLSATAVLTFLSTAALAQSSDAAYPLKCWVNELPGESTRPYYVEFNFSRVTEADPEFSGRKGCGSISVGDNNSEETILSGQLNYAGKGLNSDGTGNGIYYFNVRTPQGKTAKIGVRINADKLLEIVSLTGERANHPFMKEKCFLGMISGSWLPVGVEPVTEKELLEQLRDALNDDDKDRAEHRTRGFGNVRQYIAAHAKLDPSKPKYAKPKGTGAINIRQAASQSSAKIGELKPGETMTVVDEYNGWCQVKLGQDKFGWVSLSVVTLTNNAAVSSRAATNTANGGTETVCPITGDWCGYLGNKGWGECAVYLQAEKKLGMTAGMSKQAGHGNIFMTDEEFVNERKYNLVLLRTIDSNTCEFTVQLKVGKQLKQGKMQIKRNGDKILMTGLDAWTKQQPFHGKTIDKTNNNQ